MSEYDKKVGERLQSIRSIFNEGAKLSARQFAYLLNTTRDRIANYETGRSSIPVSVLYSLYIRGINPVYLISGEGSLFAENEAGRVFKQKIKRQLNSKMSTEIMSNVMAADPALADDIEGLEEFDKKAGYFAAAGKIVRKKK